jgi:hypothetical protein
MNYFKDFFRIFHFFNSNFNFVNPSGFNRPIRYEATAVKTVTAAAVGKKNPAHSQPDSSARAWLEQWQ